MYHFAFFPPFLEDDLLMHSETGAAWVTITRIHTYIILKQLAPTYACSITRLKCLITASVVMQLLWVTADTTRKCINGGICKGGQTEFLSCQCCCSSTSQQNTLEILDMVLRPLICKCAPSLHWQWYWMEELFFFFFFSCQLNVLCSKGICSFRTGD